MSLKLLHTTTTSIIGKHEAAFWSDGVLEIEEITDGPDHVAERVCLDELAQYRLLQLLLVKFANGGQP